MTRSQHTQAQVIQAGRARDDGLRRVRKITWRIGLLAAAAATVMGAKFAHITASLPHLSTGDSSAGTSSGSGTSGSSSSGISSSSGVSGSSGGSAGGGTVVSGGS